MCFCILIEDEMEERKKSRVIKSQSAASRATDHAIYRRI